MLRRIKILFVLGMALAGTGTIGVGFVFAIFGRGLPDYSALSDYAPPMVTRVHAGNGSLVAEFAVEKRVFVPLEAMPKTLVRAFIAAEDKTFYSHPGIDIPGIVRALATNLRRMGSNRRPVGASTITQQVAKNFLLTNEVSYDRKIKEVILAFRMERAFTKDRILELYLNEIYLGIRSYGVAAAALNYFNKSLSELTVSEAAYLAGLPKAPNNYHPVRRAEAAVIRRDYVLDRMVAGGDLDPEVAMDAKLEPLVMRSRGGEDVARADYFVEEVRRELMERYGERGVYREGMSVRTTVDPRMQHIADRSLRAGLLAYDKRHGWRGPLGRIELDQPDAEPWPDQIRKFRVPIETRTWRRALVRSVTATGADIVVETGEAGRIPFEELVWAREWRAGQQLGPKVKDARRVLSPGDVIVVEPVSEGGAAGLYTLRQIPEIGGGIVAMDPHTGRVLAMTGGFSYHMSQFNRVTQAVRQPGSAFKPFVYLAALDKGFTPSSLILDAPFVIDQGPGRGKWKPHNYAKKFYGPSPMRLGIEKSRNLMTVRLAQRIGINTVGEYAERFGIVDRLPRVLSMSLGAGETTLMRLTTAYAMLVNGGKRITPTLIDRVQDRNGITVFQHDTRACDGCQDVIWEEQPPPEIPDTREQVADPRSAYQIVSMLQGVVQRGTGRRIRSVGKPLAGKTGTTNESYDSWFVGFAPDLAVGVFTGFDTPRTLGRYESGSSIAAPIFRDFMAGALRGRPAVPFRIPPGIRLVRISLETGLVAKPGDNRVILEAFKPGTEPTGNQDVLDGSTGGEGPLVTTPDNSRIGGDGGIY